MKLQARSSVVTVAAISVAAFPLLLAGCEDAAAKQRETVQAQIKQASLSIQSALAGTPDDAAAQKLTAAASELGRIEGGEPGQQAARSLLSATALREAATIKLNAAEDVQADHRLKRSAISNHLDNVMRLRESAGALESVDAAAERQQLQTELASAREQVAELRRTLEEMDAPINERAELNAAAKKEVDALRAKVNELRRRAQELGNADGFPTFHTAIQSSREADKIEYAMSQREIELDYNLTPELVLTDTYAQQFDAMIKAVEAAQSDLANFAKSSAEQVAANRARISESSAQIASLMKEIQTGATETLDPAYEEAQAALEKAASQAQQGARVGGEDAQSAKLASAQVQETLGRMHWSKLRGLTDQRLLLEQLSKSGIDNSIKPEAITAMTAACEAAAVAAKESFTSAQELLTQVTSRNNPESIEAYTRSLEAAVVALENKPPEPTETPALPRGGAVSSAASDSSKGAASPEELLAVVKSCQSITDLPRLFDLTIPLREITGLTPATRKMGENLKSLLNNALALEQSLQNKFGQGFEEMLKEEGENPLADKIATVRDAQLQNVQGIRGSIKIMLTSGEEKTVPITQIRNRWYLGNENQLLDGIGWAFGMDEMSAMMGGGGAGMPADPQMQQFGQMFMQMIGDAMGVLAVAMQDLAKEVDRGEYSSIEDFKTRSQAKIEKIMQDAMGKMMPGGMPGMGGLGGGMNVPPGK